MANNVETKFYDEVIKLLDDNKSTNNIIFTRTLFTELNKEFDDFSADVGKLFL
jgi:hypothetical protein